MKKFIKDNLLFLIVIITIVCLFNIRLPYYINTPGGTIDITSRIEYKGKREETGSINLLYVTEYIANIPTFLLSYILPDWDLESIKDNQLSSNETPEEINIRNKVMLDNSINNATYVAYKAAAKKVDIKSRHNVVIGATLDNGLKIGDEVLSVDGKEIENVNEFKKIINNKNIGDELNIVVKRNDKEIDVKSVIKDIDGNKALGIVVITNYDYEIDPKINLTFKSSESGSSGGLMLSLCIYNAISDEDILKGRKVAGTGTIDIDGNVGEISGIKYKIMGAVRNKMDVVLVPSANYDEALRTVKSHNYKIKLVKVDTFSDAVRYLKNN